MEQYGVKFYKIVDGIETEIDRDSVPDEYIYGLIKILQDDAISRERINCVFTKMGQKLKERIKCEEGGENKWNALIVEKN